MTTTLIIAFLTGMALTALLIGAIVKTRTAETERTAQLERQRIKLLESELGVCRQQLESRKAAPKPVSDADLLEASLNSIQDLVIVWDLKLKPQIISPSFKHFLGYDVSTLERRSLSKETLSQYMTSESAKRLMQILGRAMEALKKQPGQMPIFEAFELELVRENRSTLLTETLMSIVPGPDGRPRALVSVTRDIDQSRQTSDKYQRLVEDSRNASFELDAEGRISFMSRAFEQICGYSPTEVQGQYLASFIHPQDKARSSSLFSAALDGQAQDLISLRLVHRGDQTVNVTLSATADYKADQATGLHGVISDISSMVQNEERLRQSEELYRGLIENMNDISFSLDKDGRYTYVSPVAEYVLGYPLSEIIGSPFKRFVLADDLTGLEAAFAKAVEGQTVLNEFRVLKRNGVLLYFRVSARFITEGGRVVGTNGILSDITLLKENELKLKDALEAIKQLSITDALTGCYNRGFLTEHLPYEIKRAQRYHHPLSLILCDLDHFKQINDTYGHQAGDQVLKAFVGGVRGVIRENMDWLARYGGEEFLVAAGETDLAGARILAERLRVVSANLVVDYKGQAIKFTASFGVVGYDPARKPEDLSAEMMVNRVDKCLYAAKQRGRNLVVDQDMLDFLD